jgi:hypothetical protein
MYQQLWGYKVEEKLYLGVCEQKSLNTTALYCHGHSHGIEFWSSQNYFTVSRSCHVVVLDCCTKVVYFSNIYSHTRLYDHVALV